MRSPLVESAALRIALTVALTVYITALVIVALVRPSPSFVALFNITLATVLLLPVSHYFYVL